MFVMFSLIIQILTVTEDVLYRMGLSFQCVKYPLLPREVIMNDVFDLI